MPSVYSHDPDSRDIPIDKTSRAWGMVDGKYDPSAPKALGDKIFLRKTEVYHERKYGDLILPQQVDLNYRMTKATVISMGPRAIQEYPDLKPGDTVLYDHFSAFYDTHPVVVVKAENIICGVIEEK